RSRRGALAARRARRRLAGARRSVARLAGALALPRRRLDHHELPLGGYADVTTKGHVDQLLPSQFALDEWDFFRRFAERELLYFRREEPHAPVRQQLVVLLDQGGRTWGGGRRRGGRHWGRVRLVLAAAVMALGRQAAARGVPFLVATTAGDGHLLDPLKEAGDALGERLEASDLTPHPGPALERVLEQPA